MAGPWYHRPVELAALPGHWLILIEAAAAVVILLVAATPRLTAPARVLRRHLGALAGRPRRGLLLVFLLAFGVTGGGYLALGPPIAKITDEYGHLLVADTWLHGRLANPSHPMWRHFDIYALQFPTYASKYPPGQGALLALGGLCGSVALGPCFGAGLLAAAMAWGLSRWLRPRWAVVGALLVLLRLAIGSYWHQSYWGGTVAAAGGALLFGALAPGRRPRYGFAGLGLVLLALSRPFEGLLIALPCLWVLGRRWYGERGATRVARREWRGPLLLLTLLLSTGVFLLYSNWRITGDPLLLPQAGYVTAYSGTPDLIFQRGFGEFSGMQARAPISAGRLAASLSPNPPQPWLATAAAAMPARLWRSLFFYLGMAGCLTFVLGLASAGRRQALPLVAFGIGTLGQGLPTFYFPHHAAALTFVFVFFSLQGARRAALLRWPAGPAKGRRPGYRLVLLLLLAELIATSLRFPGLRPPADDESRQRAAMVAQLEKIPGRHLVIVEPRSRTDWVWNGAAIDDQPIVWARTFGRAADRELREYFRDRQIWRARLDVEPPILEPWQETPEIYREPATGMSFVEIPAGTFQMGSPPPEKDREAGEVRHTVTLSRAFFLGRNEVTQAQWKKVMGSSPSHFAGDDLPVENVSWNEIQEFLARLEKLAPGNRFRLPTEAEWEYACRAGTTTTFAFGDQLTPREANIDENPGARHQTLPVGSFPPNAWGLFDLHGNVWEWCADEPCAYPEKPEVDPFRACGSPLKTIRGGSWLYGADSARCALRYTHAPQDRGPSLGFRVVREPRNLP